MGINFLCMKNLFAIFFVFLHSPIVNSQSLLNVGDKAPNVTLSEVINFPGKSINVSDYHDKLLVLDFWATYCVPCVKAFPKLDSLQRKFDGRVQFLPVTWEDKDKVQKFFNRLKKQRDYVLPTAIDTVLYKYFVDKSNQWSGQYVWIFHGEIVGITTGKEFLTEDNIRLALSGKKIGASRSIKRNERLPDDFLHSYISPGLNSRIDLFMSSVMSRYIKGLASQPYESTTGNGIRLINLPLSFMYSYAYKLPSIYEILIEVDDKDFFHPSSTKRDSSNLFCYELITSISQSDSLRVKMQSDLKNIFGYTVKQETRMVDCAILKGRGNDKLFRKTAVSSFDRNNYYLVLRSQSFDKLTSSLDYYLKSNDVRFVFDETGITSIINLELNVDMSDFYAVKKALFKYGIDLVIEKRLMEIYVVTDDNLKQWF